jgi:hypothetical protein
MEEFEEPGPCTWCDIECGPEDCDVYDGERYCLDCALAWRQDNDQLEEDDYDILGLDRPDD